MLLDNLSDYLLNFEILKRLQLDVRVVPRQADVVMKTFASARNHILKDNHTLRDFHTQPPWLVVTCKIYIGFLLRQT